MHALLHMSLAFTDKDSSQTTQVPHNSLKKAVGSTTSCAFLQLIITTTKLRFCVKMGPRMAIGRNVRLRGNLQNTQHHSKMADGHEDIASHELTALLITGWKRLLCAYYTCTAAHLGVSRRVVVVLSTIHRVHFVHNTHHMLGTLEQHGAGCVLVASQIFPSGLPIAFL